LGAHLLAQGVRDIQVKADRLAGVVDFVEGRVGAFGTDAQLVCGHCLTTQEYGGQGRQENCLVAFHRYCSFLWLDMNCLQRSDVALSNCCSGVPISSTWP